MRFILILIAISLGAAPAAAADGAGNRLGEAVSTYLALHADDTVHWRPWGEEALAEARRDGKLIFLSIGYFACHWCHVMQRDNFKNPATAALMNARFVNILVDREEHPNVDSAYMKAAAMMGFSTGWPLNLVLTPDAKPVFGGTYYPPERRRGTPGFTEMLMFVARAYEENPSKISDRATANFEALTRPRKGIGASMSPRDLTDAAAALLGNIDTFYGGFGGSVKFPFIPALSAMWRAYLRTGNYEYRDAVVMTMDSMILGGLYDHIGGGFARYTVDPAWSEPHFEKMLYVNAQMIALMTEIWRETRAPLLETRIRETVKFLLDEMRLNGGAFAAALDSDSLDRTGALREGAYYVWTAAEIDAVLGPAAALFKRAYSVTAEGNWHGTNVLHRSKVQRSLLAVEAGKNRTAFELRLAAARKKLASARANRPRPLRDDKALADWNGIAIAALIEAGAAFGETAWIDAARDAFSFVVREMSVDGRLVHAWYDGRRGSDGILDDYARMASAAVTLFEHTGAQSHMEHAKAWVTVAETMRDAATGAYYNTTAAADAAGLRLQVGSDDQLPSGNAVLAETLARLYYLTGEDRYRDLAAGIVGAFHDAPIRDPVHHGGLLRAADTLNGAIQVVIVGNRDEPAQALIREVWRTSLPGRALDVIADGSKLPEGHPAFGKIQIDGMPTAYVCVGTFCSLPVQTQSALKKSMHEIRGTGRVPRQRRPGKQ